MKERSRLARALVAAAAWFAVLLLLAWAVTRFTAEPGELERLVREARPVPLAVGILAMFGGVVFLGFRWRALLPRPHRVSGLVLAAVECVGMLLNYTLPGPVGELAAAGLLQRRYGIPAPRALAAAVHARFLGLAVAAGMAGIVWLVAPLPVSEQGQALVAAAAAVATGGALALGAMALWPRPLLGAVDRFLTPGTRRLKGPWKRALVKLEGMLRQFLEGLSSIGSLGAGAWLRAGGWTICGIVSVTGGVWLVTVALRDPGDPSGLLFSHCASTAGAVLLFAFPGGQVGWDAAYASLLVATSGVELDTALAVTVLVRGQQLAVVFLGALFMRWLFRSGASTVEGPTSTN